MTKYARELQDGNKLVTGGTVLLVYDVQTVFGVVVFSFDMRIHGKCYTQHCVKDANEVVHVA